MSGHRHAHAPAILDALPEPHGARAHPHFQPVLRVVAARPAGLREGSPLTRAAPELRPARVHERMSRPLRESSALSRPRLLRDAARRRRRRATQRPVPFHRARAEGART